jgi:hypothetical protein
MKDRKIIVTIIVLLILVFTSISACSQNKKTQNKSAAICHELSAIVTDEKAPGMIAAIISGEGVTAIGSAGVRKAGSDVLITCSEENLEWAKGKVLTHNGSNGIWYSTVLVAPKINRAYVVVTNSRDFSATGDICSDMLNKLIKMDLETTGD